MNMRHRITVLLVLAVVSAGAQAAPKGEAVSDCVDLGAGHVVSRYGSQFVLVADGDARYRVNVDSGCDALGLATRLELSTAGQAGRVCPASTRVKTNEGSCDVESVQRIDAATYARFMRKR